jgi:hypothetical protein
MPVAELQRNYNLYNNIMMAQNSDVQDDDGSDG